MSKMASYEKIWWNFAGYNPTFQNWKAIHTHTLNALKIIHVECSNDGLYIYMGWKRKGRNVSREQLPRNHIKIGLESHVHGRKAS